MSEFAELTVVGERIDDAKCLDITWLQSQIGKTVKSAEFIPMIDAGGLNAAMKRLRVVLEDDSEVTFVLKRTSESGLPRSKVIGLPREAFFYTFLGPKILDVLPSVVAAYGDFSTGEKAILMNDMSDYIQSGYFFGTHSPHNLNKDMVALIGYEDDSAARVAAMETISKKAFVTAAKVHAQFWRDRSLLDTAWLRSTAWLKGQGEESWLAAQAQASDPWRTTRNALDAAVAAGTPVAVNWSPKLIELIEASIAKISWADYQQTVSAPDFIFTLVHGDFHPANMMWKRTSGGGEGPEEGELALLDWEVVGLGSGPQDCAQYVISHMRPDERRACESSLVHAYYDALIAGGVDSAAYPFSKCWEDYVQGGIGRWIWLLTLITAFCPPNWVQYFQDQVLAFAEDHGVTVENIPMPRV